MLLRLNEVASGRPSSLVEHVRCTRWASLGLARDRAVRTLDSGGDDGRREVHSCLDVDASGALLLTGGASPGGIGVAGPSIFVSAYAVPPEPVVAAVGSGSAHRHGAVPRPPLASAAVPEADGDGGAVGVKWIPWDTSMFVVASKDGVVSAWDAGAFRELTRCKVPAADGVGADTLRAIDISRAPGGTAALVAVAGAERDVRLLDLRSNAITHSLLGNDGGVRDVVWSPRDGHVLATAGADCTARLFDVRRAGSAAGLCVLDMFKTLADPPRAAPVEGAAPSPKRRRRALLGLGMAWEPSDATCEYARRKRLARRAETTGRAGRIRAHDGAVTRVRFSLDGQSIVTGGGDQRVRVWDALSAHCLLSSFSGLRGDGARVFEVSGDGSILLASGRRGLDLFDMVTGALLSSAVGNYGRVEHIVVHPVREEAYTASSDGELLCWAPRQAC